MLFICFPPALSLFRSKSETLWLKSLLNSLRCIWRHRSLQILVSFNHICAYICMFVTYFYLLWIYIRHIVLSILIIFFQILNFSKNDWSIIFEMRRYYLRVVCCLIPRWKSRFFNIIYDLRIDNMFRWWWKCTFIIISLSLKFDRFFCLIISIIWRVILNLHFKFRLINFAIKRSDDCVVVFASMIAHNLRIQSILNVCSCSKCRPVD